MPEVSIVVASDTEIEHICAQLRHTNYGVVGEYQFQAIELVAKDSEATVIGGLVGEVTLEWLALHVLWVSAARRNRGIGSRLLREAERRAQALGAHSAYLDTFDWQAAGFYAKHGYREFGRLNNFPNGHHRIFMSKTLS